MVLAEFLLTNLFKKKPKCETSITKDTPNKDEYQSDIENVVLQKFEVPHIVDDPQASTSDMNTSNTAEKSIITLLQKITEKQDSIIESNVQIQYSVNALKTDENSKSNTKIRFDTTQFVSSVVLQASSKLKVISILV